MWQVTNQPPFCLKGSNAYAWSISNFTTSGVQRLGHNTVGGNEMQKWWPKMICAHVSFTDQKRVLHELKPTEWQRQGVKAVNGGDRVRELKRKWTLLKTPGFRSKCRCCSLIPDGNLPFESGAVLPSVPKSLPKSCGRLNLKRRQLLFRKHGLKSQVYGWRLLCRPHLTCNLQEMNLSYIKSQWGQPVWQPIRWDKGKCCTSTDLFLLLSRARGFGGPVWHPSSESKDSSFFRAHMAPLF